jgi:hypothetical protein
LGALKQGFQMPICEGKKKDGTQCTRQVPIGKRYCWQHSSSWQKIRIFGTIGILITFIGLVSDILGFYDRIGNSSNLPNNTPTLTKMPTVYPTTKIPTADLAPDNDYSTPSPFTVVGTNTPYPLTPQTIGWVYIQLLNNNKETTITSITLEGNNYFEHYENFIVVDNFPFKDVPSGKDYSLSLSLSDGRQINIHSIEITPGTATSPFRIIIDFARPLPDRYPIDRCTKIEFTHLVTISKHFEGI